MNTSIRQQLINAWFDYVKNYLTIERYAEHNGLTVLEAKEYLALADRVIRSPHPDS